MKKKISLVVAVLVLVLGLAGCGNAKTVSYDKDTLIQSCDAVFDIIESGSITSDQITEMSDWNQGYLMAQFENQTGVQMEADTFATALEGWKASLEECGDYESHKDYEFEASSTGVTVTAPATFSDRSADLEFVFDENMTLESFTVNAHYGMSEILEKAGLNTLLGMGTVFVMLIFMSFIISLIKYVPALLNGTSTFRFLSIGISGITAIPKFSATRPAIDASSRISYAIFGVPPVCSNNWSITGLSPLFLVKYTWG